MGFTSVNDLAPLCLCGYNYSLLQVPCRGYWPFFIYLHPLSHLTKKTEQAWRWSHICFVNGKQSLHQPEELAYETLPSIILLSLACQLNRVIRWSCCQVLLILCFTGHDANSLLSSLTQHLNVSRECRRRHVETRQVILGVELLKLKGIFHPKDTWAVISGREVGQNTDQMFLPLFCFLEKNTSYRLEINFEILCKAKNMTRLIRKVFLFFSVLWSV